MGFNPHRRQRRRPTDIVFVAAQGYSYGPQKDRGLYRTTDGGKTWQQVLFVDGAADKPSDCASQCAVEEASGNPFG